MTRPCARTITTSLKSAVTATPADGHGLCRLAEQCGADYQGGTLLYAGDSSFALGNKLDIAVPLSQLWEL